MASLIRNFREAFRKGDLILLLMCVVITAFGCLMIASTTNQVGPLRYLLVQIGATVIGIILYVAISGIDAEWFTEHRTALVIFNTVLLFMLVPFGVNVNGNRSWLDFPFLPFNIQVAEICKITYILIMASVMAAHQNKISSLPSVLHMALHLGLLGGLNMVLSSDAGVTLIFVFIFAVMAFTGGVSLFWFALAGGVVALGYPLVYEYIMDDYQRLRMDVLFNPELDASGIGARYHTAQSLRSITGGGMTGQGLFQGHRTQTEGALFAQHTDYIFSAIGEELGYVGCALVILMLAAIVARILWVGWRSQDYMRRIICFGAAAALIFQVCINVGMCIGVMPVIGLTLPFVSYGGSSIVTLYAMLGLVSGVYARPSATSHEHYIRPPYMSKTLR